MNKLKFFYEEDKEHRGYRWWSSIDPRDMFDIINRAELERRIKGARLCMIPVVDHLPGFCDLEDKCPDHLGYH